MSLAQETAATLQEVFNDRFTTSRGICAEHGTDISHFEPQPPDAVVFPETTQEVQAAVKACAATGTPVVPYGAGTSLEGNIHALTGGVTIDLSRMDKIISVHQDDLDVVVQPGVRRVQLNECSFRSTRAPTPLLAAWPQPEPPAPTRCDTGP